MLGKEFPLSRKETTAGLQVVRILSTKWHIYFPVYREENQAHFKAHKFITIPWRIGLGKYVPSSLIKDIFQCFITNSEPYTDEVLKNYMVWPWTHDAPTIPTDFIMNNNCKIKPLIKTSNEEKTHQLSSNQLTHNCFLFNFLRRGREKEHNVVALPYSRWNKVHFFESFSTAEQP